jgi:hypothetical protein
LVVLLPPPVSAWPSSVPLLILRKLGALPPNSSTNSAGLLIVMPGTVSGLFPNVPLTANDDWSTLAAPIRSATIASSEPESPLTVN